MCLHVVCLMTFYIIMFVLFQLRKGDPLIGSSPPPMSSAGPWAADALDCAIFLFWSASPVVSVIALAMCIHEFGGRSFWRNTEGLGVFVWLSSLNTNSLSAATLTPPLKVGNVGETSKSKLDSEIKQPKKSQPLPTDFPPKPLLTPNTHCLTTGVHESIQRWGEERSKLSSSLNISNYLMSHPQLQKHTNKLHHHFFKTVLFLSNCTKLTTAQNNTIIATFDHINDPFGHEIRTKLWSVLCDEIIDLCVVQVVVQNVWVWLQGWCHSRDWLGPSVGFC